MTNKLFKYSDGSSLRVEFLSYGVYFCLKGNDTEIKFYLGESHLGGKISNISDFITKDNATNIMLKQLEAVIEGHKVARWLCDE